MALEIAAKAAKKLEPAKRVFRQTEVHVVESKLDRADGSGVLLSAITDFEKGTVQLSQDTRPITFKKASDLDDIIEFHTILRDQLAAGTTFVVK
jgi:hypothetical protein